MRHVRGPLSAALAADDLGEVFPAVLEELADPHRPTVLAVEDVHWADSATLDLLRHVGRRVDDLPALLLLTYRPDEVGREHPSQGVLGTADVGSGSSRSGCRSRSCWSSQVSSVVRWTDRGWREGCGGRIGERCPSRTRTCLAQDQT